MLTFKRCLVAMLVVGLSGCSYANSTYLTKREEGLVVSDICGRFIYYVELAVPGSGDGGFEVRYIPDSEAAMVELNLMDPGPSVEVVGGLPEGLPELFTITVATGRPGLEVDPELFQVEDVLNLKATDFSNVSDTVPGITTRGKASEVLPELFKLVNCNAGRPA